MGTGEMKETALELFQGLARSYESALDFATLLQDRYWKKWVADRADVGKADLVLDVGCGTLLLEERLLGTGCTMVGIDLTEEMLRVGQAKSLPGVRLLVNGDAEALPFPAASFDAVVSCYVAKYVDVGKFAGELARVVKPGGRVIAYDFVKPRGASMPVLSLYLWGVLRIAGFLLRLAKNSAATTFTNLPRIVAGATWDLSFRGVMEAQGFETLAFERLSSGVVAAYCGDMRRGESEGRPYSARRTTGFG